MHQSFPKAWNGSTPHIHFASRIFGNAGASRLPDLLMNQLPARPPGGGSAGSQVSDMKKPEALGRHGFSHTGWMPEFLKLQKIFFSGSPMREPDSVLSQ